MTSVTRELGTAYGETRTCANCGTACVDEYCARGVRVRRSPHHPRPRWDTGAPPEASVTPADTSRRHDDIPIHPTDSASQFRMDVDCDDAPFELTELDHLALATPRASTHAPYDSDDDLLGRRAPRPVGIEH